MRLVLRGFKYLAIALVSLLLLGVALFFEESTSFVRVVNESSSDLTDVRIGLEGDTVWTGDIKAGKAITTFENHANSAGSFDLAFSINSEQRFVSFGYVSGPLGDSHVIYVQTKDHVEEKLVPTLVGFLIFALSSEEDESPSTRRKILASDTPREVGH